MNLIFFDIDGTLAIGRDIPKSAEKALARLRQNGDLVFICTGRSRNYVEEHFGSYADGFVCSNGRLAFKGTDTLYDCPLTEEQLRDLITRLDEVGAVYLFFGENSACYGGDPAYYEEVLASFDQGELSVGIDPAVDKLYSFDVCFRDIEHRKQIEQALQGICLLNPHGPHPSADVTVLGVDKGTAIKNIAKQLHIDPDHTYAFGDGVNDICMIQAAGHGIAMGNAVEELKQQADYITTNILEDGVWNGLKHYHLI